MNHRNKPAMTFLGGIPEEIAQGLREFSKSAEILSAYQPRLVSEYPMKWIGVYRGKFTPHANDLPSLVRELEKRGVPMGDVIIRFIERNQRTLILQASR